MHDMIFTLVFLIFFSFYFLPSIIAGVRSHRNLAAILILNLFLGWTFIGWVVSLIWAVSADAKASPN
jgi:hypothetical protein